ncbi:hypothetical protein EDD18DRAFT_37073 [Armillaria luteobubalina]|uniref:F-box domain-containing protein n=1 Tax=Armillaria luteobubalina TaxID=153913 RepID=A0AA39U2S6_9AGAR|nr:hypothetical protein EDD18DRAFT_37073 [Armillaria luteobubalina]
MSFMASFPSPQIHSACSWHSCPDIPKSISNDPQIQALLKSNIPPLEAERVSLLATVSESSNLLSILKEKIDHAQETLNMLLDGQAKVTEHQRAAKTLLHPIRSIPNDVLKHIFQFCVHEVYDLLEGLGTLNSLESHHPPWTLSQVCRSWRRVSLSTASLWRCLCLDFDQYLNPNDIHLHQFMLGLHLQRARQYQLTIRLSSINDISSHAFMPILLTSIPYWKHLRTCIPAKSLAALSAYGSYLESLRYLDIDLPKGHCNSSIDIHTFEMAQSLRILKIESTLCHNVCLPDGGRGLTELTVRGPFVKNIFPFLSKTRNVNRLRIIFDASKPFERLDSPILMPKVTKLVISEWDDVAPSSIARIFESLELPKLSSLTFVLDNEDSDDAVLVFPEILPHHHCHKLRRLEVDASRSRVGKAGLIDLLTRATNMQHLTVSAKVVEKDLLFALTRSDDKDDILPELRTLDLRGSKSISDHKLLLQMVGSRMNQIEDDDEGEDDSEGEDDDEEEDDGEEMQGELGDDEGSSEDEDEDEDGKEAKNETVDVEENNEGTGEEDSQDTSDEDEESVMLEKVYLDFSMAFDDLALTARWETLKSDGFIVES